MRNETVVIRVYNGGGAELLAKFQYMEDASCFIHSRCKDNKDYGYFVMYCTDGGHCEAWLPGDDRE